MPTPTDHTKEGNIYFLDPESAAEMARLNNQDAITTIGMGGHFSEQADLSQISRVLDVACGPGSWAQEVAFAYPQMQVVGFDISEMMIKYASAQTRVQNLTNLEFRVMDMLKPLDFPDGHFDLVNARFITFLPLAGWPPVMQELVRITRPGGIVRLTETEWWHFANSPALGRLHRCIIRFIKAEASGGIFSDQDVSTGVLPMLGRFLLDAGCVNVQHKPHIIDYSYGTGAYETFRQNATILFKLFQPQMVAAGIATQQELDQDYHQMLIEMMREDFRGLMFILTAWGEKPA